MCSPNRKLRPLIELSARSTSSLPSAQTRRTASTGPAGEGDGEGGEVLVADDGLPAAALAGALLAALLDQRPRPDDVAGQAHRPEDLRDAHAVGRGLDLEVAEPRALDLLLLGEQLAADERADEPAHLGRAEERADGSAGGGDSELGHGSVGLLEAVGGDDAPEPLRVGAVLDAGAGIGVGVDQREWARRGRRRSRGAAGGG